METLAAVVAGMAAVFMAVAATEAADRMVAAMAVAVVTVEVAIGDA